MCNVCCETQAKGCDVIKLSPEYSTEVRFLQPTVDSITTMLARGQKVETLRCTRVTNDKGTGKR